MGEDRASAHRAFDHFVETYRDKYPKAVACLERDREALLAFYDFYDFPAAHWRHIRTTNPIESAFATIRHRTDRAKGCVSRAELVRRAVRHYLEHMAGSTARIPPGRVFGLWQGRGVDGLSYQERMRDGREGG